ncbi:COPII coat assembly protein [Yarrowia sp. C11]|nr:COPII coat assembly protein [Yarrowia sp. E02]KAG5372816.1 COPII coat assembly protein [Yarrowia sp. C11]
MAKKNNKKSKAKAKKPTPSATVPAINVDSSVAADPAAVETPDASTPASLSIPESAAATETTASVSPTSPVTNVSPLAEAVAEQDAPGSSPEEEEDIVEEEADVKETVEESEEPAETEPEAEPESPEGTTPVLTVQPNDLAAEPTVETVDVNIPVPAEPEEVEHVLETQTEEQTDPVVAEVEQPEPPVASDKDFFSTLSKEEDGEEEVQEEPETTEAPVPAAEPSIAQVEKQLESRLMEDPVVESEKKHKEEETRIVEDQLTERLMKDPVVEEIKHERAQETAQVEKQLTERFMEDPVVEQIKQERAEEDHAVQDQLETRLEESKDDFFANLGSEETKEVETAPAAPKAESKPEDDFFSSLGGNPDETAEKTAIETQPEPESQPEPVKAEEPKAEAPAEDDFFSGLGKSEPEPTPAVPAASKEEDDFMASLAQTQKPEQTDLLPQDDFFNQLGEENVQSVPAEPEHVAPEPAPAATEAAAPEDDFFSQLGKSPEKPAAPAATSVSPVAPRRGHKVQPSEADFFAQLGEGENEAPPAQHEPPQPQPITLSLDEDDDLLLTDEDEQAEVLAEAGKPNPPAQSFAFLEDDDLLESDQDFLETDDEDQEPIAAQTGGDFRANQQQQNTYFPTAPAVPAAPVSTSRYNTPTMPSQSQFGGYGAAQSTPSMYQPVSSQSTPSAAPPGKRVDKNKSDAFDFPTGMIPKVVKKQRSQQQLPQAHGAPGVGPGLMPAFGAAAGAPPTPGMPPMGPPRPASNQYAPPSVQQPPTTAPKKNFFEELPPIPVKPISRQPSYALSPPRAPFAQEAAAQQPRRVSDSYGMPPHGGPGAGIHSAPVSHHNSMSGPSAPHNPYAPPSGPSAVPPKTSSPYAPPPAAVPPKVSSPYAPPPPSVPPKTSSPYAPPPHMAHSAPPVGGPPQGPPRGASRGVPVPQPPAAAAAAAVAAAAAGVASGPPPAGPPRVSSRNAYAPRGGAPARGTTPPVGPAMAYSPSVSPKRVVQQAPTQSPRRYSEFKDIGQKSTVSDEILRKRQFPIFRWSNSKNATCLIAPQIGYATAVSQTSVRLVDVSKLVSTNEDVTRFPGPLFTPNKGPVKSKKKELEKWVADHVNMLDSHNADADRVLLWKLVGVYLSNDGVINAAQVRAFLTPHFEQSATGDGSAFTSAMDLSSSSFVPQQGDNGPSFSGSDANHVLRHLQSGCKDAAIRHCMDRRLWGHSLLIASTMGPEKWKDVVAEFIKDDVRPLYKPTLQFLYSSFGGVTPSTEAYGDWKETVSYILTNAKDDGSDLTSLVALGDDLVQKGYVAAGHFCYVVSRAPLADKITLLGSEGRDLDAILLSETYEFALGLKTNVAIPQMQLYKLVHAEVLADLGYVAQAQRYAEYLNQALKSFTDKTSSFQPAYISRLIALSDRVSSTPGANTGSWFSRPKLDKVLGHLDKSLSKFVAGEEAAVPGASAASDTVFSQIAATPGISRTTSVVDLSQQPGVVHGYPQQQPPYGVPPTRASTGNILRPQGGAGPYDRPNLPRSSSAMDAGPANYGYERASSVASVHSVQSDYPRVLSPVEVGGFSGGNNAYAPIGGAGVYPPPSGSAANAYAPSAGGSANAYAPPSGSAANAYAPGASSSGPSAYAPPSGNAYAPASGASPYTPSNSSFSPRQPAYGRSYASTPEHHIEEEEEAKPVEQEQEVDYSHHEEQYEQYEQEAEPEPEPEHVASPPPPPPPVQKTPAAPPAQKAPAQKAGQKPPARKVAPPPKPSVKPAYNPYDPGSAATKKPAAAASNKYAPVNSSYSPSNAYAPPASTTKKEPEPAAESEAYGYGYGGGYGGYDPYSGYEAPAADDAEPTAEEEENEKAGEAEAEAADYPDYGVPSYGYQSQAADDAGDYGDEEGAVYTPAAVTLPPISNLPSVPLPGLEPAAPAAPPASRYAAPPAAAEEEDDDDFGVGNKKPAAKKEDKKVEEKDDPKDGGKKGWFGGWFKKGEQPPADDKKVYKAKLGEKSNFYYSEEHKRWINGDLPIEDQIKGAGGPPPPPKAKKPAAPPAGGAPPPSGGAPPAGASRGATPPVATPPASGTPPVPGAGGAPRPAAGGPPRPKVVDPLEGFLTGGPPTGAPRKGARKSAKSRYVDIMNN